MRYATAALAACGIALSLLMPVARAGDTKVNCRSHGPNGQVAAVLKGLDPAATNIVHVSGHCVENLVIRGFDQLTLVAEHGAVIEGVSGVDDWVIQIGNSQRVEVQGFIIQGGIGVLCTQFSSCRFIGDTVQGTKAGAGLFNAAITVDGSDVLLDNVVVQDVVDLGIALYGARAVVANNLSINGVRAATGFLGGAGLFITAGSLRNGPITIEGTDGTGLLATAGSVLDISSLTVMYIGLQSSGSSNGVNIVNGAVGNFGQVTVQRSSGAGMLVQAANLEFYGPSVTISGNGGPGIFLQSGSRLLDFANPTVTNNQFGLYALDVSFAFLSGGTFTGNAVEDIYCDASATVQGLGNLAPGAVIDCPHPASASATVPKALTVPATPALPSR